ncbi:MAG: protein translocase subunit SecD [Firmicutes bacterium]|nr:protein translocase subunit SecD [Bacillota bacterium]
MKKIVGKIIILIILFLGSIAILIPTLNNTNFGLDLSGGFEVLYQVSSLDGSPMTHDKISATYKTISKRIDTLGVSEPNIVVEGEDRIRVELAGVTNSEEARNTLSKVASLSFRDTNDNLLMNSDVISGAKIGSDASGRPAVALSVKDKNTFYKITKQVSEMSDNRIVIWLDYEEDNSFKTEENNCGSLTNSKCLSVASVGEGFASDVIIQGNFTMEEVEGLVDLINSGSLPTKLEEISSKTVNASLGEDALNKTFTASVIGITLIMLVIIIIYKFAGFVASVGLMIYSAFTFLLFWLVGGVLTLPGIAAAVIGIGMAVDSCVISFSRIKDELKSGSKLKEAVTNGNKNSFVSIFDANITTLIVAIILFIFGESSVKGFATMLIISIFVTMFVMVFIVRWLINMVVNTKYFDDKEKLFVGFNKNKTAEPFSKLDFVKTRKWSFPCAIILLIVGVISLITVGLNLGIDFKGGTSITIKYENSLTEEKIKEDLESMNYSVYSQELIDENTSIVKISNTLNKDEVLSVSNHFKDKYDASTDIGVVSNLVKKDLVKNAFISVILASVGIIIYITCRFKFSYAISGIIALVHDVFFIIALFSLFRLEVSSIFIAAILSIIGYSINDTIVTFDRIREKIKNNKNIVNSEEELNNIINSGLKDTVGRSLVTTLTTLIPVICLIIFGSHEINNFNIALLFGLVSGTYSSVFIACQIFGLLFKGNIGKDLIKKDDDDDEPEEKIIKGING